MNRATLSLVYAVGGLAVLMSGAARADWYVGANAGQSGIDANAGEIEDAFLIDDDFVATGTTLDKTDVGWKAYLGYRLSPYVGFEAGYADLGEASFLTTIVSAPPPNDAMTPFDILGTATADGFQLSALLVLPVGPVSLFARAGGFRWEAEFTERIIETGAIRVARTEAQVDALYGAGLELSISDPIAVRLEWERLEGIGEGIGGRSGRDIDYFSAGVAFRF